VQNLLHDLLIVRMMNATIILSSAKNVVGKWKGVAAKNAGSIRISGSTMERGFIRREQTSIQFQSNFSINASAGMSPYGVSESY
jgi:hypothetical protein